MIDFEEFTENSEHMALVGLLGRLDNGTSLRELSDAMVLASDELTDEERLAVVDRMDADYRERTQREFGSQLEAM